MAATKKRSRKKAAEAVEELLIEEPSATGRGGEITGLVLLALAVALSLAIFSFSPADLESSGEIANWIGPVGAYAADVLLYILGVGALVLSLVIFGLGGFMLVGRRPELKPSEFVGYGMLIFSGTLFCHLIFAGELIFGHKAGGLVGELLGELAVGLIGGVGTYIFASSLLLLALMLVTDMSLGTLVLWALGLARGATGGLSLRWRVWRETRRRLREEAAEAAEAAAEDDLDALVEQRLAARREKEERKAAARADKTADKANDKANDKAASRRDKEDRKERKPRDRDPLIDEARAIDAAYGDPPEPDLDDELEDDFASFDSPPAEARREPAVILPDRRVTRALQSEPAPAAADDEGDLDDPAPSADGPQIVEPEAQRAARLRREQLAQHDGPPRLQTDEPGAFELPSLSFLDYKESAEVTVDRDKLRAMSIQLEETLENFGVKGKIVEIRPGPVITMFEFSPAPGVKLSKIANLADDLAMALAAISVRIIAPIPGKGVVGIEVPNDYRETVYLKELIASDEFLKTKARMPMALGKGTDGAPVVADMSAMPHLLVAGATGSGKSVAVNTMIVSLLFRFTPDECRLIMVDPKMLEFSVYEGIPHLMLPVVTDPKKAATALKWAVDEMESRYAMLAEFGVRNIASYNEKVEQLTKQCRIDMEQGLITSEAIKKLKVDEDGVPKFKTIPNIVIIIDEFADLMMVASKDVETCVARLAQKARAAGVHLILATQRPSVDVITGLIKANFPTRIALRVAQRTDSRTILDSNGAEHLLGRGDMLYLGPGKATHVRVHGAYVSEEEIERIVVFLKDQGEPQYDESLLNYSDGSEEEKPEDDVDPSEYDEHYDEAVRIVTTDRSASISMLQRKLRVGYNRAARMVELMEKEGIVGPAEGAKPRAILAPPPP